MSKSASLAVFFCLYNAKNFDLSALNPLKIFVLVVKIFITIIIELIFMFSCYFILITFHFCYWFFKSNSWNLEWRPLNDEPVPDFFYAKSELVKSRPLNSALILFEWESKLIFLL